MVSTEFLDGGMGGVVRVGDTVRKPTGFWTPAVHALLRHLDGRLPHIPRVHGVDAQGREVLDFLPGEFCEPLTLGQITSLTRWTRAFHEAVNGFVHPGPWRYFRIPEATLIGHNDIAHYNACFDDDDLVGVFDWDMSGPTTPLMELAFTAWNIVPLWSDIGVEQAAARLTHMANVYGGPDARQILQAVPARIGLMLDGIPVAAAGGDQGMRNLMALGEPDRSRRSLVSLIDRIPAIDRALS